MGKHERLPEYVPPAIITEVGENMPPERQAYREQWRRKIGDYIANRIPLNINFDIKESEFEHGQE